MNRESTEHLSSLMDGEISQETARFLVRRLGSDGEWRQTWARYHLVRDCLRHQEGNFAHNELSSRVQRALSGEPDLSFKRPIDRVRWIKPIAGAAIAASVALIAIGTVSNGLGPITTTPSEEIAQMPPVESFVSPNPTRLTPVSQPVNLSGGIRQSNNKINTYLLRHYQVTEQEGGGRGFVSFVPIVVTHTVSGDADVKETETDLR